MKTRALLAPELQTRLTSEPIRTKPNVTFYEWAGSTLQRLLGTKERVAESWAFFSGSQKPARISIESDTSPVTMETLVTNIPEVLGPIGADPDNHQQKYFFVKFLDPSDFPRFAYVGFDPKAVAAVRTQLETRENTSFTTEAHWEQRFRLYFADLLWQDRQALEELVSLLRSNIVSQHLFSDLKAAYKTWAIKQATANWTDQSTFDVSQFVNRSEIDQAVSAITQQQRVRRQIVRCMHRIDFENDQAILIETPTLHAIAGLSLQIHPKAPGNFYPKDELWIYKEVPLSDSDSGWILVEPQRTFDKTESGADFFTPFAWETTTSSGSLVFRKPISREYLEQFVMLMDARPRPQAHYVRQAQRATMPQSNTKGQAQWYRVVDEPNWPYFTVWELRFEGPGESVLQLRHESFVELHATRGRIELSFGASGRHSRSFFISAAEPAFLPATLPYESISFRASEPAELHFFTRNAPSRTA